MRVLVWWCGLGKGLRGGRLVSLLSFLFFFSILPVVVVVVFKEEGRLATQFSIWKKDDGVSSFLSQVMEFLFFWWLG